jgi:hypothetical protein
LEFPISDFEKFFPLNMDTFRLHPNTLYTLLTADLNINSTQT